jgi:hypothetical protein
LNDLKPETTIHFILSKLSAQQQEDFFSKLMLNEDGLAMQIYAEPLLGLEKYEVAAIFKYFGMSGDHDFGVKEEGKQQLFGELHSVQTPGVKEDRCSDISKSWCNSAGNGKYNCYEGGKATCNTCTCK